MTVFKVISFKRLSCPKSAKSLFSGLLWIGSERKGSNHKAWVEYEGGWECDGVLGMPLLLDHFLCPHPSFLPLALETLHCLLW